MPGEGAYWKIINFISGFIISLLSNRDLYKLAAKVHVPLWDRKQLMFVFLGVAGNCVVGSSWDFELTAFVQFIFLSPRLFLASVHH